MKPFIPLALTTAFLSPIATNAETWYLVAAGRSPNRHSGSFIQIPFYTENECKNAGTKLENERLTWKEIKFICLRGK